MRVYLFLIALKLIFLSIENKRNKRKIIHLITAFSISISTYYNNANNKSMNKKKNELLKLY